MSGNVQEIASAIKEIVTESGQVLGAQLSSLLKARVPEWRPATFGVRSLREFVTNHVVGVVEAGRSGMDVVYALEGAPLLEPPVAGTTTPTDSWRVWVSPNGPHALVLDSGRMTLGVTSRGGPIEPGQILLEPPSAEFHREVARAFLPNLPASFQSKLQAVMDHASERWWQAWTSELRGTEYIGIWNEFRRQKFEEQLTLQLHTAGLAQPVIDGILKTVRERHGLPPSRPRRTGKVVFHQQDDVASLRGIVAEAIQHMSIAELRELRLPIGIVLDVLATSKSR